MKPPYILDTSVLVTASNDMFPIELAPGFWDKLEDLGQERVVGISAEVVKELERQDDDLLEWVKARPFFIRETTEDVQAFAPDVLAVEVNEYKPPLIDPLKPHSDGDVWVIALAAATNGTVVTAERSAKQGKKKAKIPDVCEVMGVSCTAIIPFMRATGFRLVAG